MSRDDCDVCDEEVAKLHGRIATLKAALIEERDRPIGNERETIRQLAQEYPEIFGDEKK